jgi:flagellar assembly protein FliH
MEDSVIRGLPVDGPALLLRRASVAQNPEVAGAQVDREAASAGFSEGLRQGRQEGASSGYEEGLRSGRQEAERQAIEETGRAVTAATSALADERSRLVSMAASWDAMRVDMLSSVEDDMVALCYEVVCRIVGSNAVLPDAVHAALVQVWASARDEPHVLLRIHPDDAALLDRLGIPGAVGQTVAWRADSAVRLGGCILESPSGGLDARLETLLAGCRTALLAARDARAENGDRAGTLA